LPNVANLAFLKAGLKILALLMPLALLENKKKQDKIWLFFCHTGLTLTKH